MKGGCVFNEVIGGNGGSGGIVLEVWMERVGYMESIIVQWGYLYKADTPTSFNELGKVFSSSSLDVLGLYYVEIERIWH